MSRIRLTAVAVIACVALVVPAAASAKDEAATAAAVGAQPVPVETQLVAVQQQRVNLLEQQLAALSQEMLTLNQQIKAAHENGDTVTVQKLEEQSRQKRIELEVLTMKLNAAVDMLSDMAPKKAPMTATVTPNIGKDEAATAAAVGNQPTAPAQPATAAVIGKPTQLQVNLPPESAWSFCATEGARCEFTGTRQVRYGANGKFTLPSTFTDGVTCDNATFGDIAPGVVKQCQVTGV
jgi:TolA-binding protein